MKGASVKVAILRFFTRHGPFSHHAKFHLWLRPPSTFFGVFRDSWQILSSKIFLIFFLCKIWVIAAPNKHFLGVWYQKWMRNKLLLLHFFSTFLNPQRTTLTYSAMVMVFMSIEVLMMMMMMLMKMMLIKIMFHHNLHISRPWLLWCVCCPSNALCLSPHSGEFVGHWLSGHSVG